MTADSETPQDPGSDRRSWIVLLSIIAVCFLVGLAFLATCVWLDWQ